MNALYRLARLSSVSALLLGCTLAFAQSPAPRIRGPIELTPSVPLEGSLDPHVRLSDDLGPLAPDTRISGITLVFKRSAAQESGLQQLLAQQTDPSSPLYHHWLTPDDFAARFGVAETDIAATESWLQSHGFILDNVSRNRDRVTFSGTATQIQQAFGAELHRYRFGDDSEAELHFAPASGLSLPPTLAPITAAVLHLSDFRPKPTVRPIPNYTTLTNQSHFLAPGDIASMYDLYPLTIGMNDVGSGQSLVIVGQSFVEVGAGSPISNFQSALARGSASISTVIVPGSGFEAIFPGDVGESELDLEYSSALAYGANIFFVYTGSNSNYNVFDALAYAITEDIAPVVSISYGGCEAVIGTADLQQANALFQEAAAQGQTIVAASGDSGSNACAPYSSGSGVSLTQQQALAVSFPADSPYVTAVGGTQMAPGTFAPGSSNYWDTATSTDMATSLISYVPEVAWNEDSTSFGLAASGGGVSSIFPRPAWQTGVPGIPAGSFRLLPDIALQSSVTSPGYIMCTDDPYIVGAATDCANGTLKTSGGSYIISGGTSFAAPIFAAILTDLNQYLQITTGLGNINPILYGLAAQPSVYSAVFHDITSGTTACAIGDGICGAPGTTGYAATPGYDMATGLGSVDVNKLATAWPSTAPPRSIVPTYMYFSNTPQTATAGASTTVNVTLQISNASCGLCTPPAPSGNLSILVDGSAVTPVPLQANGLNASAAFNFVAPSATGSHVVVIRYPGDAYHLPSYSTFAVLVGSVIPSGSFTLSASNLTLAANSTGSTRISITPSSGYSGALSWSSSFTGGTVAQTLCYIVQSRSINGPSTATMTMGAGTACGGPAGSRATSRLQGLTQRTSLDLPARPTSHRAPAAVLALLLFVILPPPRRRKLLPILSAATLAILATTLTGCGGGSTSGTTTGNGNGTTGTQPQVYTITIRATDSVNATITASTTFTLTVD